jgi:hypothetical protein
VAKIILEAQIIEEDVDEKFLDKSHRFFNELIQLQQKYAIKAFISADPFENTTFFDLIFITHEDFNDSDFVAELEDILDDFKAIYIYKQILNLF